VLQALAAQAGPAFERLAGRQVAFELHRTPLLYPAFTDRELDHLTRVAGELREAGASAPVDRLTGAELAELEPALDRSRLLGGLRADGELRVRPESLTAGLRTSLEARGARVRDHAPVRGLRRDGTGWLALGPDGEYRAEAVVVAAGVGSRALLGRLGLRLPIAATKGYSRTYAPDPGLPRRPVYLEDPKVSVSVFDGGVRVSGTLELGARRLTLSPRRLEAITSATRAAFPRWKPRESPVDWAGMRSLSPDGLPYVGAIPGHPGLYVATAHATLGITLAPLTAELLADCLLGDRPDPLISALDPARALRTRQPRHTEGAPS
jgi:D-amino-acid dehydrogenase